MDSPWIITVLFLAGGVALYLIVRRRLRIQMSLSRPIDPAGVGDSYPDSEPASDTLEHKDGSGDFGGLCVPALATVSSCEADNTEVGREEEKKERLVRLINLYSSRRQSWLRSPACLGPVLSTLRREADMLDSDAEEWVRLEGRAGAIFEILDALEGEQNWAAVESYISVKVGPISGAFRHELQVQIASAMQCGQVDLEELRRQFRELEKLVVQDNQETTQRRPKRGHSLRGTPL